MSNNSESDNEKVQRMLEHSMKPAPPKRRKLSKREILELQRQQQLIRRQQIFQLNPVLLGVRIANRQMIIRSQQQPS